MKTLNEYIKESILDDENILTGKLIKDSQNPFILLRDIFDSIDFDNDKDGYLKWRKACDKQLSKIDFPNDVDYYFMDTRIAFKYKNHLLCEFYYGIQPQLGDYKCAQFCNYISDKVVKPKYRKIPEDIINWIENVFNVRFGFEKYPKNSYWKLIK